MAFRRLSLGTIRRSFFNWIVRLFSPSGDQQFGSRHRVCRTRTGSAQHGHDVSKPHGALPPTVLETCAAIGSYHRLAGIVARALGPATRPSHAGRLARFAQASGSKRRAQWPRQRSALCFFVFETFATAILSAGSTIALLTGDPGLGGPTRSKRNDARSATGATYEHSRHRSEGLEHDSRRAIAWGRCRSVSAGRRQERASSQ